MQNMQEIGHDEPRKNPNTVLVSGKLTSMLSGVGSEFLHRPALLGIFCHRWERVRPCLERQTSSKVLICTRNPHFSFFSCV
jgi:hypothetical protein